MKDYYVYMVGCADGSYYTGVTNNHERRVREHNEGKDPKSYTYSRRPVKLVYAAHFENVYEAIAWEKVLKKWSRKKKEAVIRGEGGKLPRLSLSKSPTKELLQKIDSLEKKKHH